MDEMQAKIVPYHWMMPTYLYVTLAEFKNNKGNKTTNYRNLKTKNIKGHRYILVSK